MRDYAELARRIKALADSTEFEGEREACLKRLDVIMEKHGITADDLSDETLDLFKFSYKTSFHKQLLFQISYKVTNNKKFRSFGGIGRKAMFIECTKSESVEIEFLYDFYKRLFNEEVKIFQDSFVQKHRLFGDTPTGENNKSVSDEEYFKMVAFMGGMKNDTPQKQIESKGGKP
jgi:hypothetical protein